MLLTFESTLENICASLIEQLLLYLILNDFLKFSNFLLCIRGKEFL